ncbi:MAG: GSCFA domain-containing protein [Muribaculaceae bacterium]|nr:GSCFA domain-containing protein [Muribaculaceae bacterium]
MEFRTPIEPIHGIAPIDHTDRIVMLGSCFTTNIGERLHRDGFNVTYNPMGALYNPATIANAVERALAGHTYTHDELIFHDGQYHCLDFPTKYTSACADDLLQHVNGDLLSLGQKLREATVWIITFGTARVYELSEGKIVGNCHKLPGTMFSRRLMTVDEIAATWQPLIAGRRVIFTVSPIRHIADTLHGNQLSKSPLLLAVAWINRAEYFTA